MDTSSDISAATETMPVGVEVIRAQLKHMPKSSGVYRMLDKAGNVLYVGKAKNLKNRVANYTTGGVSQRIARMVSHTASMEIVTTHTEAEALLLEANMIKKLAPRYNILLRDDKSFPFIHISRDHDYPRIVKHRGAQKDKGEYFGPFASVGAVNEALTLLQKAFLLRPCSDFMFASRTRPCLQYQIKRCSAPCVDKISKDDYDRLVGQAIAFLRGKSREMQDELLTQMQQASENLDFETAATLRDRIRALTRVQQEQRLQCPSIGDADVIGLHRAADKTCVQVFFFRAGQNFGNKSYYPSHAQDAETNEIMAAFIGQFYQNHMPPKSILLSDMPAEAHLLEDALAMRAGYKVSLNQPQRGDKLTALQQVVKNAEQALERHMAQHAGQRELLEGVARLFGLDDTPQRIEVYDNSHIMGRHALGGMIVAGPDGFIKNAYRKFNYSDRSSAAKAPAEQSAQHGHAVESDRSSAAKAPAEQSAQHGHAVESDRSSTAKAPTSATDIPTGGDDYAMMREMLTRRFSRLQKEDPDHEKEGNWPDLLLIDGGAAHLKVAEDVFAELGVEVPFVCIAKGVDRNAGREWFHVSGISPYQLPPHDPVLHYLQRLRDEAHRFAIGSHRNRRSKAIRTSELDAVPGVGALRKKALLHHFGSAKAVSSASLVDLEAVEGINKKTAETIYSYFHS
jgi:excinuclease ABC subunit C